MPEKLSVVVVDTDKSVQKILRNQLRQMANVELGFEWKQIESAFEAVQRTKPDILILELPKEYDSALRWIERIRLDLPEVAIFVSSWLKTPELIISTMRAGAREFLSRPIQPDELKQAINKVLVTKEQVRAQTPERGKIISVFSKKGGLGVTTLAVNLAVALSETAKKKAALIDLDLQLGDDTRFLNLSADYNILDALNEDG